MSKMGMKKGWMKSVSVVAVAKREKVGNISKEGMAKSKPQTAGKRTQKLK